MSASHPLIWAVAAIACVAVSGCASSGSEPTAPTTSKDPKSSVTIVRIDTTGGLFVRKGRTIHLTARAYGSTGDEVQGVTFSWRSLNPSAASVDPTGGAGGLELGTARIVATVSDAADTAVVTVATPWRSVAVSKFGVFTCGLTIENRAFCWGDNQAGELGDGTNQSRTLPAAVAGDLQFTELALGADHSCGITAAGAAYCWGSNAGGELGDGTLQARLVPTVVPIATPLVAIDAGGDFTCALAGTGRTYCWGTNDATQLGIQSTGSGDVHASPVEVVGAPDLGSLSVGVAHACGLTTQGSAQCWGWNDDDQLGNGLGTFASLPGPVQGTLQFAELRSGYLATCARTPGGAIYCWGGQYNGHLPGQPASFPSPLGGGLAFQALAGGHLHWCGLAGTDAYCWGAGSAGQLGDSTTTDRATPVTVYGHHAFVQIAAGAGHTCAVDAEGSAFCWGSDEGGALGDGAQRPERVPVVVRGP